MDDSNIPKVNDNTEINDIRTPGQFKGISFSKYKKTEVRKQLIENLKKGRIANICSNTAASRKSPLQERDDHKCSLDFECYGYRICYGY